MVQCLTNFVFWTIQLQWQGMDGLKGPVMSGTGFYIKRASLFGNCARKGIKLNNIFLSSCFLKHKISMTLTYKHCPCTERLPYSLLFFVLNPRK